MARRTHRRRDVPGHRDDHALSRRSDPNRERLPDRGWSSASSASSRDWGGAGPRCRRDAASAVHRPAGFPGHVVASRNVRHPFPGKPRMGCCRDAERRNDAHLIPGWLRNHPGGAPGGRWDGGWSRRPWGRACSLRGVGPLRGAGLRRDAGPTVWGRPHPGETLRAWDPGGRGMVWEPGARTLPDWPEQPGLALQELPPVSTEPAPMGLCSCRPWDAAQVSRGKVWGLPVWRQWFRLSVRMPHAPCAPPVLPRSMRRWKRTRPFP